MSDRRRNSLVAIALCCGACGGGAAGGEGSSSSGESGSPTTTGGSEGSTGTSASAETTDASGSDESGSASSSGPGGDGEPPTAALVFPGPASGLPSGPAYPLVGAGAPAGDEPIELVELLVDGVPVASGPGVPMLVNLDDVDTGLARSSETIDAAGYLELTVTARGVLQVVGLDEPDDPVGMEGIAYPFILQPIGKLSVAGFQQVGTYAAGDVLRIELDGDIVRYRQNGVEIHSVAVTVPPPFVAEASLGPRSAIAEVALSIDGAPAQPPSWTDVALLTELVGLHAPWDSTGASERAHDFAARLTDVGGDSATSRAVAKDVDNTLPTCSITMPADGEVIAGTVTLAGTVSDLHLAIDAFFVDDALVSQQDGLTDPTFDWDSTTVSNGDRAIRLDAYDEGGNLGSCEISVTVAN